tara:strand:+ start:44 stop:532 length:489 start_codon:yes stop_codon:yes gene_type:complete
MTNSNISFLHVENQQFEISVRTSLVKNLELIKFLIAGFSSLCFLIGAIFFVLGAKPVAGFLSFELVLLCIVYKHTVNSAKSETTLIFGQKKLMLRERDMRGNTCYTGFDLSQVSLYLENRTSVDPNLILSQGKKNKKVCNFISKLEKEKLLKIINHQIQVRR